MKFRPATDLMGSRVPPRELPSSDELRTAFVAHSSILIRHGDVTLLCDPWLHGTVFNDSWELQPAPDLDTLDLRAVTHLWISHEHPDHFHLPSLQWLAEHVDDPASITVLSQEWNSGKLFDAMSNFGYRKFVAMPHLKPLPLGPGLDVFVYAHKQLDSALGVLVNGEPALLNINDTELSDSDRRRIRQRFGSFPLLFNQFSIGGYDGSPDLSRVEDMAAHMLDKLVTDHRALGADLTVPFASFVRFNCLDNAHLNAFHNTALEALQHLDANGCSGRVVQPGSEWRTFDELKGSDDRPWYERWYHAQAVAAEAHAAASPSQAAETVPLHQCAAAFADRTAAWRRHTNPLVYQRLDAITAWIPDLERAVRLDFGLGAMEPIEASEADCDLVINSQPLWFTFATPFGMQTLGVSGRYRFNRYPSSWRWVRMISSLANADIHLGVRSLLRPAFLRMMAGRASSIPGQLRQQLARVSPSGSVPV